MKLPQLYLRDLFLLVAVVALLCGWWFQQGQIAEARRQRDEAHNGRKNAERIEAGYLRILDAYTRDGRLHHIQRPDGSVEITDKPPAFFPGGFGPGGR